MAAPTSVAITGSSGFTGQHLCAHLLRSGYSVYSINANLLDKRSLDDEIKKITPTYVIHLAGISNSVHGSAEEIYSNNVIGTVNLLDALSKNAREVRKVVLASSAAVYGVCAENEVDESYCPKPNSHYGCSKLAMEHLAANFEESFNIVLVRPFNYTGVGHSSNFLLPKLIDAFRTKEPRIVLGNIHVAREFNDVRDVSAIYRLIMESERFEKYDVVNLCSGRAIYIADILDMLSQMSGHKIIVERSDGLVRKGDPELLCGSSKKLMDLIGERQIWNYDLVATLRWMLSS